MSSQVALSESRSAETRGVDESDPAVCEALAASFLEQLLAKEKEDLKRVRGEVAAEPPGDFMGYSLSPDDLDLFLSNASVQVMDKILKTLDKPGTTMTHLKTAADFEKDENLGPAAQEEIVRIALARAGRPFYNNVTLMPKTKAEKLKVLRSRLLADAAVAAPATPKLRSLREILEAPMDAPVPVVMKRRSGKGPGRLEAVEAKVARLGTRADAVEGRLEWVEGAAVQPRTKLVGKKRELTVLERRLADTIKTTARPGTTKSGLKHYASALARGPNFKKLDYKGVHRAATAVFDEMKEVAADDGVLDSESPAPAAQASISPTSEEAAPAKPTQPKATVPTWRAQLGLPSTPLQTPKGHIGISPAKVRDLNFLPPAKAPTARRPPLLPTPPRTPALRSFPDGPTDVTRFVPKIPPRTNIQDLDIE